MSLFAELRRRNVFRVALAYGIIAWVLAQVADLAFDNFGAPAWVSKSVLFVLILGFPLAVFFAWAFELTPEGIKKEKDVDRSESITPQTGKKLNFLIIGVLAVAVAFLLYERTPIDSPVTTEEVVATDTSKMSIAVLPFDNRSNREEDEFFTEGIHDDLLTTMANIGSMKVISRTSVMEYKNTTKKIPEIAKELGVANILEGGIQRSGNQVRINVQLIDAATDEHLWAEIYDRQLTAENLFSIQSEVSKAIATALQATLSPEEQQRISAVPTENLEAYETYLRGRQRWETRTADSTAEAVELFLKAIELDPNYAEAWAGLGDAYRHQVPYGGLPEQDVFPKAEQAIRRALELNRDLAEANAAMGGLLNQRSNTNPDAGVYLARSIELNPSYSPAYNWMGLYLQAAGDFEEAARFFSKGLEVDPLSAVLANNLAYNAGASGQFDVMKARIERNIELHPESPFAYMANAVYDLSVQGRLDEAVRSFMLAVLADPNEISSRVTLSYVLAIVGEDEFADRWLQSSFDLQPDNLEAQIAQVDLSLLRNQTQEATVIARRLWEQFEASRRDATLLEVLSTNDLETGNANTALRRYAQAFPQLMGPDPVSLTIVDADVAIEVVRLLRENGSGERAEKLLEKLVAVLEAAPLLGPAGSAGLLPSAYVLAGRSEDALAALRRAVDAGWRIGWRYVFDYHWSLEPLRDNPEFQSLRMEVATDMARQRENLHRMEATGELPVVPGMEPIGKPSKAVPAPT